MGKLSDVYGRKPLLAISALGLLFGDVISMAAAWFPHRIPVYLVLLEFGIGGLTGSFAATMAIIQAYAVDCTEGEARVSFFSRLHACMYLGQAVGPAAGGLLVRVVGQGDMLSVFYAATVCHASFILFVLFGIRETSPKATHRKVKSGISQCHVDSPTRTSRIRACFKICNIFRPLRILRPNREASSRIARRNLPVLACIDGVSFGIQLGLASVLILYSESKLGWKTMEASFFVSLTNATRAIILTAVIPLLSRLASGRVVGFSTSRALDMGKAAVTTVRFSIRTIQVAILLELLSNLGFAMADNTMLFTLSGVLAAAGAPISPTVQSLMTTYVDAEKVGELLGAVSLLHALARCVIPAIMQFVYSTTIRHAPGTVFWILSGFFTGTFLLSLRIRR
jgi:MFS family permease